MTRDIEAIRKSKGVQCLQPKFIDDPGIPFSYMGPDRARQLRGSMQQQQLKAVETTLKL